MEDKKKANNIICHCYSVICKYIYAYKNKKICVSDKKLKKIIDEVIEEMNICDICSSQCCYDDFGYCIKPIEEKCLIDCSESAKYVIEKYVIEENYVLPKVYKEQTK